MNRLSTTKLRNFVDQHINLCFAIGYVSTLCASMLDTMPIVGGKNTTYLNIVGIVFLFIHNLYILLHKTHTKKNIFLTVALISLIIAVTIVSRTTYPIRFALLISSISHFGFKRTIKIDLWSRSILFLSIILLYFMHVINTDPIYRYDGTIRYSFGFPHPNTFAIFMTTIVVDWLYISYHKTTLKVRLASLAIITSAITINQLYVDSRASLILIIIVSIAYFIPYRYLKTLFNIKAIKLLLPYAFLLLTIASFTLTFAYNAGLKWAIDLNQFLSHRIHLWDYIIQNEFSPNLFGLDTRNVMHDVPLDNAFLYSFYRFGIIFFIILIVLFYRTMRNLIQQKEYFSLSILIGILAYGIMESIAFYPGYNTCILLLSYGFLNKTNVDFNLSKEPALATTKKRKVITL